MFVCLFVWGFKSHSIIFHPYGVITIAGEGLQILTYAWHSRQLSSEGFLACHIYCDTGQHAKATGKQQIDMQQVNTQQQQQNNR